MQTSTSSATRPLDALRVPLGPAVLRRIFPAVAAALEGGPALLPVPERPAPVREAMLQALRPSIPVEAFDDDHVALVVPTSGEFPVVYQGRDGLTRIWKIPAHMLAGTDEPRK